MAEYLITGGAGFIGCNIVFELLKRGHSVRVLDNFSTGKQCNLDKVSKDIELIEGDIRSYHIVQEAVEGISYVLHQAALPSVPRSIKDAITTSEVNVQGTLNLLEASLRAGVKRLIFASSSSVYGDTPKLPKDEMMKVRPISPYAVSKLAAEFYCRSYYRIYGLETVSLRYFNVFGPNQNPHSQYAAVITKFVSTSGDGREITV
ncbi:MAG: NAD-dependent epimerase/dehydratase family protein, partial [bacterium]